jgi:Ran-binding protein 9/10
MDGHHNRSSMKLGYGNGSSSDWLVDDLRSPPFFIPSYMRGSRYADQLVAANKARIAAAKEARAQQNASGSRGENEPLSTSSSGVNLHKMVPSHRGMTHDIIERAPPQASGEEAGAQLPTKWNDRDKLTGLEVLTDGTEIRFGSGGLSKASHDEAAAVRADHPMPRQCGVYYFEVSVVSKGREGFVLLRACKLQLMLTRHRLIGIGFSSSKVPLNRLPGWEPDSWAYHGDDGYSFCCTSSGKGYGPKFTSNDVIGCGVNFRTGTAFFTKNGVDLGMLVPPNSNAMLT